MDTQQSLLAESVIAIMSDTIGQARTMKRKNVKGLALSAPPKPPAPAAQDAQLPGANGDEKNERGDTLEIGVEFRLDLRAEDLIVVKELGAGNGGTVSKVRHAATNVVMARKIIHVEAKRAVSYTHLTLPTKRIV